MMPITILDTSPIRQPSHEQQAPPAAASQITVWASRNNLNDAQYYSGAGYRVKQAKAKATQK